MKDYKIKHKITNIHLINEMDNKGFTSAKQLSDASGVPYSAILDFISLKSCPYSGTGIQLTPNAERLCFFLKVPIERLFPESLMPNSSKENNFHGHADYEAIINIDSNLSPEQALLESRRGASVQSVLGQLTERDARIINKRFGIGCSKEYTLDEIGNAEGISGERVRCIVHKGIAKLKRHNLQSKVEDYMSDDYYDTYLRACDA